jgi:hypothetical protein
MTFSDTEEPANTPTRREFRLRVKFRSISPYGSGVTTVKRWPTLTTPKQNRIWKRWPSTLRVNWLAGRPPILPKLACPFWANSIGELDASPYPTSDLGG